MKNVTIVTPTYNEKDNVKDLLNVLIGINKKLGKDYQLTMLFVDDNSPDGTAMLIKENIGKKPYKIDLLSRPGKLGLGTAYVDGFRRAITNGADYIIQMDADFSHDPAEIPNVINALRKYDFVIGSRYIKGGETPGWSMKRKLISSGGNAYTRLILGKKIHDWTGGFNGWSKKVLETIDLNKIKSNGFSFQFEIKYKALKHGFDPTEIPIIFHERAKGKSKFNQRIFKEAILAPWKLKLGK